MLQRRELSASTKLRGRKLRGVDGASLETPGALRGMLGSLDLILPGMGPLKLQLWEAVRGCRGWGGREGEPQDMTLFTRRPAV